MPGSAWADGIMAEMAGQLSKMVELSIPSQPNPLSDHQPHPRVVHPVYWWKASINSASDGPLLTFANLVNLAAGTIGKL